MSRSAGHARRLSAALLQLPVPESRPESARSNVPLASGYLSAYASARGHPPALLAPRPLQDHGGDAALLGWLDEVSPDVVGFSCFLWNIDRTLELARGLKARRPETVVVLGGPEIAPGHPLLAAGRVAAPGVDSFVVGEGEETWARILSLLEGGERPPRVIHAGEALDLAGIPNPHLSGALEARPGDSVFLETVRGCTRRCDYCYYAKAAPFLRTFPLDRIPSIFAYARERGVQELYVLDPCFNAARDFRDKLRLMADANTSRIPLHTELELESVTPEVASLLSSAGFASVEAGLQSVNRQALVAVHRGWRRPEFLRGAALLHERGIAVRTGVILGLPRDTMEGFMQTIAFVKDHGLAGGVELFPLSVLPGTALRARATELGLEYMVRPPYWVLGNDSMVERDFIEAIELAEAALDLDFFQPMLPHFGGGPTPAELAGFRDLRGPGSARRLTRKLRNGTQVSVSLTLLVAGPEPEEPETLRELGHEIRHSSPSTLVQLVVDSPLLPPSRAWDRVADCFHTPDHYVDRIHYYKRDPQERFSVRLWHLTGDPSVAQRYYTGGDGEDSPFDLIVRYSPRLLATADGILTRLPALLIEGEIDPAERSELARLYRGLELLLIEWER